MIKTFDAVVAVVTVFSGHAFSLNYLALLAKTISSTQIKTEKRLTLLFSLYLGRFLHAQLSVGAVVPD